MTVSGERAIRRTGWLRRWRSWRRTSQLADFAYRVLTNRQGLIGAAIVAVLVLAAVFADEVATYGPSEQIRGGNLKAPSLDHFFGTDVLGRDLYSRLVHGLRISLRVGAVAVGAGGLAGTLVGYFAGYAGGFIEAALMRVMDTMLAFPGLLTAIAVLAVLGVGERNVIIALAIGNVPVFARLARASMLTEKVKDYVLAARSLGASPVRIVFRHIAINTLPPLLVQAALAMTFAVILEASLSFLGLGAQPPAPSVGAILSEGRRVLVSNSAWWYVAFPTLMLSLVLVSFNFLADAITEAIDPYRRS